MKVLKDPERKWSHKFSCGGCNAELEADETDILHKYYEGDMREPSYHSFYLKCPCCEEHHSIKEAALPKLVLLKAKSRKSE